MTTKKQQKEIEKYTTEYSAFSVRDLKSMLKLLESDKLGKRRNFSKIQALKTLLL